MDLSKIKVEEEQEGGERQRKNSMKYEISTEIKKEHEAEICGPIDILKTEGVDSKIGQESDQGKQEEEFQSCLVSACFRQPKVLLHRLEEVLDIKGSVLLPPHDSASAVQQGASSPSGRDTLSLDPEGKPKVMTRKKTKIGALKCQVTKDKVSCRHLLPLFTPRRIYPPTPHPNPYAITAKVHIIHRLQDAQSGPGLIEGRNLHL
ncbi:hypothetical protein JZ751_000063 [Albula glossodonta]|uniref:Uncharacterized protein n=1 Tax=Albula glossodonta TaxID=121402 RepID=A0A8T2PV72_9TELE|nr:hypothetical protein JZ751_000063 [Albula glossodonta]